MGANGEIQAATVCEPCKRRKKKCSKELPSCARCARLFIKCSYYPTTTTFNTLPALNDIIPDFAASNDSAISGVGSSPEPSNYEWPGFDVLATTGLHALMEIVSNTEPEDVFCRRYFKNFHPQLPFIDQNLFYLQLETSPRRPHLSLLLVAMFLASQLDFSAEKDALERAMKVYPTLKGVFALFHSKGDCSVEVTQAGLCIASFEHCEALHEESWLTIGMCARMSNIQRLRWLDGKGSINPGPHRGFRCTVSWATTVLERIISAEYMDNRLPCATEPPRPDDLLPMRPTDISVSKVIDGLLLPTQIEENGVKLECKPSTTLSAFATTVQATYLSNLVTLHVLDNTRDPGVREKDGTRLDIALQAYWDVLIPPIGMADGSYCGAFGIRTSALFYLHQHNLETALQQGNAEAATRATDALKKLTELTIFMTKASEIGNPLDYDTIAFWCSKFVYSAAIYHIRFGTRDESWRSDLDMLKNYFNHFLPRYKYYRNCVARIEIAEQAAFLP